MENNPTENKKSLLQNDRLLVCGMLALYGLCIMGLGGVAFWWLSQRNQALATSATATAAVIATQQAEIAATTIVSATEQSNFEFIERFDKVSSYWYVGQYSKEYGDAYLMIKDGVYIWDVTDSKGFSQSIDFYKGNKLKNFDVYMDAKFVDSSGSSATCSGFFFRRPAIDWMEGAYIFTICEDAHFEVQYYGKNGWQAITKSGYEKLISQSDWNRIGINARQDQFMFTINGTQVFEMSDDRLKEGSLGIFVCMNDDNPTVIWFDNFGYQSR